MNCFFPSWTTSTWNKTVNHDKNSLSFNWFYQSLDFFYFHELKWIVATCVLKLHFCPKVALQMFLIVAINGINKIVMIHHFVSYHSSSWRKKNNVSVTFCNSKFGLKGNFDMLHAGSLNNHVVKVHDGKKQFTCDICNANFVLNVTFNRNSPWRK